MDLLEIIRQELLQHGYKCGRVIGTNRHRRFGVLDHDDQSMVIIIDSNAEDTLIVAILVATAGLDGRVVDYDLADPASIPELIGHINQWLTYSESSAKN